MVQRKEQDTSCGPKREEDPQSTQRSSSKDDNGRSAKLKASALEDETKVFLGRARSVTAKRAAEYQPTMEEFTSVSFADFVRGTLLGVPFEGESDEGTDSDETESSDGGNDDRDEDGVAEMPQAGASARENLKNTNTGNSNIHECRSMNTEDVTSDTVGTLNESETIDKGNSNKNSAPTDPNKPTRVSTRLSQRKALQPSPCGSAVLDVEEARPHSGRKFTNTEPPPFSIVSKRSRGPPSRHKLADGIAKVTPPEGWWDRGGIANDLTARGEHWQAGTRLGDIVVAGPIKQCASGIGGIYDYTLLELPPMSVCEFRNKADQYRKRQIGSEVDEDTTGDFMDGLARKFWRRLGPTMEAPIYGADMEGTFFDGAWACGWNVDRLESCLQVLRADAEDGDDDEKVFRLPGVTSAYLYFGMWASVFAAHTEDMNLLSINYLHAGAPKYWYAISPEDSHRFESLAVSHFAAAASGCGEFLRHKRFLLSPTILKKAGIRFTTQIQRAGDVMITFPGSYHFGFNTGFNVAESTNFAVPEWVPMGSAAQVCMCHPHSVRIDMSRFKVLLNRYEKDMMAAEEKGVPRISYSGWAKAEAGRRKDIEDNCSEDEEDVFQPEKVTYRKGKVVEVMRSVPRKSTSTDSPKKKAPTKARKKKAVKEDWRLALRVRSATFTPQTQVLCFLPCADEDVETKDEKPEKCFTGVITKVVEGHARIHFAGMLRKDDVWMPTDSTKLFLDGGPEDAPAKSKKQTSKRRVDSKTKSVKKKKLRT